MKATSVFRSVAALSAALFLSCLTPAQEAVAPVDAPAAASPKRPRFPASFDEAQFRKCLDGIADPANVMAIKFGYFVRKVRHPFPKESALPLLEETLKAENPGCERWYRLQSLYAFACFHMQRQARRKGYDAYDSLFGRALANREELAAQADAVFEAARDYTFILPQDTISGTIHMGYGGTAAPVLAKAYECWLRMPGNMRTELSFKETLKHVKASDAMREVTAAFLAEPGVAGSFDAILRAGIGLRYCNAGESLNCLKKAEPYLAERSKDEQRAFFMVYADDLDLLGKKGEEADILRRCISATGSGQARLAKLLYGQGDVEGCRKVLEGLATPDAPEAEIVAAAEGLARPDDKDPDKDKPRIKEVDPDVIAMVRAYLARPGDRDVRSELRVRQAAATLLARYDRTDEALAMLDIARLRPCIRGHILEVEMVNAERLKANIGRPGR